MKILVLGADGMLGHQFVESMRAMHDIHGTLRLDEQAYRGIRKFLPPAVHFGVNVQNYPAVEAIIDRIRPNAVVNAVGIVKQREEAKDAVASLEVNALLPHRLAISCAEIGARLVQISTDCVFSGRVGMYRETDFPDAGDLYGRSKLLGEVTSRGCITLRTSIIGLELARRKSLIEWFLAQAAPIKGFRKAIYSGFTTMEMARIIEHVLAAHPEKDGLYHVSSAPIDKFSLLTKLAVRLDRHTKIAPDDEFSCDRSLDSSRFQSVFSYTPPSWEVMLEELSVQIKERYQC